MKKGVWWDGGKRLGGPATNIVKILSLQGGDLRGVPNNSQPKRLGRIFVLNYRPKKIWSGYISGEKGSAGYRLTPPRNPYF
jgi:hypothetical protein